MGRLSGKTALVTGAAQGIGAAIVHAFAGEGAAVWASDTSAPDVSIYGNTAGGRVRAIALNVAQEGDWDAAFDALAEDGAAPLILVNNAGISGVQDGAQDPEHASLEAWRKVMAVNLDGVFLGSRAVIRALRASGQPGAIINIASRSGHVGVPMASGYAASKAAVLNHTRSVALYCAREGLDIRCNAISPGAVLTPMWEAMLGDGPGREDRLAEFTKTAAIKRFADPREVAALAVLLAGDDVRYMTGETLSLDGGLSAGSAEAP